MKKLIVTAIGAAAAFGASAGLISTQRFESVTGDLPITNVSISALNTWAGGDYWGARVTATNNTYDIEAVSGGIPEGKPFAGSAPGKALKIETEFTEPLNLNIISGGTSQAIGASDIYFDSLVKFTVCDDAPELASDGAKIALWVQADDEGNTNLYVRAGYLTNTLSTVKVATKDYKCRSPGVDIVNDWHRVTIKAILDITKGYEIPGFVVFLDGEVVNGVDYSISSISEIDGFEANLSTTAAYWAGSGKMALFPSMVQGDDADKNSLKSAGFAGTGSLTDIVFTDEVPAGIEADPVFETAPATVTVGGVTTNFNNLAALMDYVNNNVGSGETAAIDFIKGTTLTAPLVFTTAANVTLDFAGFIITNTQEFAAITNSAATLTITNSTGKGGIYTTKRGEPADWGEALQNNATLTIQGGNFWGYVHTYSDEALRISGGAFADNLELEECVVTGKKFADQPNVDDLFDVVDDVTPTTYTITVADGEHMTIAVTTNDVPAGAAGGYVLNAGDKIEVTYTAETGYTLSKYQDAIATVSATATIDAPIATAATYGITYYNGETPLDLAPATYTYGVGVATLPSASADTGYQFAGWYDNAGLTGDPVTSIATTATGAKTLYAKFSATTYTITFVNEIGADPASTNYTIESSTITLPTATTENLSVQFDGWTNATITAAITEFTPTAQNVGNFTLYAAWSSTGSSGYDGGDGSTFTVDPGTVATVEAKTGAKMTDTVAGKGMTYAQAYALGLVDEGTGDVADLETTIEIKNGKVVVGLSEEAKKNYTITLKVYEKASLTADWPENPTRTITLEQAADGFTPSSATSGFYKTEVSISNKN